MSVLYVRSFYGKNMSATLTIVFVSLSYRKGSGQPRSEGSLSSDTLIINTSVKVTRTDCNTYTLTLRRSHTPTHAHVHVHVHTLRLLVHTQRHKDHQHRLSFTHRPSDQDEGTLEEPAGIVHSCMLSLHTQCHQSLCRAANASGPLLWWHRRCPPMYPRIYQCCLWQGGDGVQRMWAATFPFL